MIRFKSAAIVCSIFVILGAVISGAGASHTLGKLGAISELAGSIYRCFSQTALAVFWMTKAALPVSTSQAVVGAIIGWNLFSKSAIDMKALTKILGTWVFFSHFIRRSCCHSLFRSCIQLKDLEDTFDSPWTDSPEWHYWLPELSVLTVWVPTILPMLWVFSLKVLQRSFPTFSISNVLHISPVQQLFFLGGAAIAVGVFTYSKRVMMTVGSGIYQLSPITAFIVVLSSSIVLFFFASKGLKEFLVSNNSPFISPSSRIQFSINCRSCNRSGACQRWKKSQSQSIGKDQSGMGGNAGYCCWNYICGSIYCSKCFLVKSYFNIKFLRRKYGVSQI